MREPPAGANRETLFRFYMERSQAREALGRDKDAMADARKAIEHSTDYVRDGSRAELQLEGLLRNSGEYRQAVAVLEQTSKKLDTFQRTKGRQFTILRRLAVNYVLVGDVGAAEVQVKKLQQLLNEARSWPAFAEFGLSWETNTEAARARVLEARGRLAEAEIAYLKQSALLPRLIELAKADDRQGSVANWTSAQDYATAFLGRVRTKLGRVAEGEVDLRRALVGRLRAAGKYNTETAHMLGYLAYSLIQQGRQGEAENLLRTNMEILDALGYAKDASAYVTALMQLAATQFSQRRYAEAKRLYQQVDQATDGWELRRRLRVQNSWARIYTEYMTRNVDEGIERARALLDLERRQKGDNHADTALARATLAAGLTYARRDAEAIAEFKLAMPILQSNRHEDEEGDLSATLSSDRRQQAVTEANLVLLARAGNALQAAVESLSIADGIRARAVQNALEASAARAAAKTPQLAEFARKSQDIDKQISGLSVGINNLLSVAPEERDEAALKALQGELDGLRKERTTLRRDMQKRFPEYNALINPAPATVDDIRASLRPDEAFLAFYFGRRDSFAWAVAKQGPPMFVVLGTTAQDMERRVAKLRAALQPEAASIADIPAFDLAAAHDLYELLLKPTESVWKPSRSLIVATNGSLGLLPLGLLPTEQPRTTSQTDKTPFAEYRQVPWLARTHAVTSIPSASALRTLRAAKGGPPKRDPLVGFGDPLFAPEQEHESQEPASGTLGVGTRGIPIRLRSLPRTAKIDSAEIAQLPRLPDTADELKAIAAVLDVDPGKSIYLGRDANEKKIKALDLTKYRIVAFATHGLVPGEINGLTEPALALTAPSLADTDGDGLLTAEEILGLRLNADWVVLSACNTGAAAAEGAEVASGLARAFFYAGTRAILVTNWSVHSASARELVTDLFRRQRKEGVSRAEALRQAMLALMDGPGYVEDGKALYAYAHPLFWAPYTIIGDGG